MQLSKPKRIAFKLPRTTNTYKSEAFKLTDGCIRNTLIDINDSANKDSQIESIWKWADKFGISEREIPRNKDQLLLMEDLKISRDYSQPFSAITYLPEAIGVLTNLSRIIISNHELTELPDSIGNLKKLLCLIIDGNNLTALPSSICQLNKLTHAVKSVEPNLGDFNYAA